LITVPYAGSRLIERGDEYVMRWVKDKSKETVVSYPVVNLPSDNSSCCCRVHEERPHDRSCKESHNAREQ